MEEIKNILEEIALLMEKFDKKKNHSFNVFFVSNVIRRELFHSDILAVLLRLNYPKGEERLKLFLKRLNTNKPAKVDNILYDFVNYEVRREDDYIDILIDLELKNGKKSAIIIENKIDAGDRYRQIEGYIQSKESEYDITVPVYLTLHGNPPSEYTAGEYADKTIPLSYSKHIIPWLEDSKENIKNEPGLEEQRIYHTLDSYKEMLEKINMEKNNRKELIDNLKDYAHLNVAPLQDKINFLQDMMNLLRRRNHIVFLKKLKAKFEEKGLKIDDDFCNDVIENDYYGFSIPLKNCAWGIAFEWKTSQNSYIMGTGIVKTAQPIISGNKLKALLKAVRTERSADYEDYESEHPWYCWIDSESQGELFDGHFGSKQKYAYNASWKEWEGWAEEYFDKFYEEYEWFKEKLEKIK
ncbi:MAG: hypothetical protein B0D92_08530 [Spirochaeta sp. LUC14_002_19_P3]|nr:MAG: hypothetical protein B0D92_08530 [Spirochaeta sp. LUC14_002_19_P3]